MPEAPPTVESNTPLTPSRLDLRSAYPGTEVILAQTYSLEDRMRYGALSTEQTEAKMRVFVAKWWETLGIDIPLPEKNDIGLFVQRLAWRIEESFPFTFEGEVSDGVATLPKQLDLVEAVVPQIEHLRQERVRTMHLLDTLESAAKREPSILVREQMQQEIAAIEKTWDLLGDRSKQLSRGISPQLDCKLPSLVLAHLLEYIKAKHNLQYEVFLFAMRDSAHMRTIIRAPGIPQEQPRNFLKRLVQKKKPVDDRYIMVDYARRRDQTERASVQYTEIKPEVWKKHSAQGFYDTSWRSMRAFDSRFIARMYKQKDISGSA